jgi:hypothetical protein
MDTRDWVGVGGIDHECLGECNLSCSIQPCIHRRYRVGRSQNWLCNIYHVVEGIRHLIPQLRKDWREVRSQRQLDTVCQKYSSYKCNPLYLLYLAQFYYAYLVGELEDAGLCPEFCERIEQVLTTEPLTHRERACALRLKALQTRDPYKRNG